MGTQELQIESMVNSYTVDEMKAVCRAIHFQIMEGDGAAVADLAAPLNELQDEYSLWATALERKLQYDGTA